MPDVIVNATITAINPADWNACFPGELEDYAYFLVTEQAGIAGFQFYYLTVVDQGIILAATTLFLTEYALATTLPGFWKRFLPWRLKLACLGAPETECCPLGFHPTIPEAHQPQLLQQLLTAFEHTAQQHQAGLLGIKDVPQPQKQLWDACCQARGYQAITSLPTAVLRVNYASMDEYLSSLSYRTRKDLRRKLKSASKVTVVQYDQLEEVIDVLMPLYQATKQRSDWQLADLTAAYFTAILPHLGKRARCLLYLVDNVPLAFNLLLVNQDKLLDKFFCQEERGRQYNLYFLSWLHNVGFCIEQGIVCYQSGQAGYDSKLRLGSELIPNWLYFKHRHPLLNQVLRWLSPWLAVEQPTIKKLTR
jgi:predicted N-acyltransferase